MSENIPDGNTTPQPEAEGDQKAKLSAEAARHRVRAREAEAERDAALARVAQLQTRELERIASRHLSVPADLLTLTGKTLADFIGEDGEVDPKLVTAAANALLGTRPGLQPRQPLVDYSQGTSNDPSRTQPTWSDLFRRF